MKIQEVNERVRRIAGMAGDAEAAHSEEDDLYAEVLAAIADGSRQSRDLARAALKTQEIEFARWCA